MVNYKFSFFGILAKLLFTCLIVLCYRNSSSQSCYEVTFRSIAKSKEDSIKLANYTGSPEIRDRNYDFICDSSYIFWPGIKDSLLLDATYLQSYKIIGKDIVLDIDNITYERIYKEREYGFGRSIIVPTDSVKLINGFQCYEYLIGINEERCWIAHDLPFTNYIQKSEELPGMVLRRDLELIIDNQPMNVVMELVPKKVECPEVFNLYRTKLNDINHPFKTRNDSCYFVNFKKSKVQLDDSIVSPESKKVIKNYKANFQSFYFTDEYSHSGNRLYDIDERRLFERHHSEGSKEITKRIDNLDKSKNLKWEVTGNKKEINGYECLEVRISKEDNQDSFTLIYVAEDLPYVYFDGFPKQLPGFIMEYDIILNSGGNDFKLKTTLLVEKTSISDYFSRLVDEVISDPIFYPKPIRTKLKSEFDPRLIKAINSKILGLNQRRSPAEFVLNKNFPKGEMVGFESLYGGSLSFKIDYDKEGNLEYSGHNNKKSLKIEYEENNDTLRIVNIIDYTKWSPRYKVVGDTVYHPNDGFWVFDFKNQVIKECSLNNKVNSIFSYDRVGHLLTYHNFMYPEEYRGIYKVDYSYNNAGQLIHKLVDSSLLGESQTSYFYDSYGLIKNTKTIGSDEEQASEYGFAISAEENNTYNVLVYKNNDGIESGNLYVVDKKFNVIEWISSFTEKTVREFLIHYKL